MLKLFLIAFIVLFFILFFKGFKPEFSLLLKLGFCIILVSFLLENLSNNFSNITEFGEQIGIESPIIHMLLKALGICTLTQIISNLCKDCGESAMASTLELVGRISVLILTLPLANELIQIALGWINV